MLRWGVAAAVAVALSFAGPARADMCSNLIDQFNRLNGQYAQVVNASGSGFDYMCSPAFQQNHRQGRALQLQKAAVAEQLERSCQGRYQPGSGTSSASLREHVVKTDRLAAEMKEMCAKLPSRRAAAPPAPGSSRGDCPGGVADFRNCIDINLKQGQRPSAWQDYVARNTCDYTIAARINSCDASGCSDQNLRFMHRQTQLVPSFRQEPRVVAASCIPPRRR